GAGVEGDDGALLPQRRLAPPAEGRLRPAAPVQKPGELPDLGAGAGKPPPAGGRAGGAMSQALVDQIAAAVLYEGYLLYPYRPAGKTRQRWTFGGLSPRAYSEAQGGADAWAVQTECLVAGSAGARLAVKVRFLHLVARSVGELPAPLAELPG